MCVTRMVNVFTINDKFTMLFFYHLVIKEDRHL